MSDLIKREDAIKAIEELRKEPHWLHDGDDYRVCGLSEAEDAIERLPSADRWIPCSERLPQIGQKVLASTKKTVFTQVFKGYYSDPTRWAWENNSVKRIEAWQPLPKPWKGADDE